MKLSDLQYELPRNLIAKYPADPRDSSKLMIINRKTGDIQHKVFSDLPDILNANCALVFNQTKVIPAKLEGKKKTGGKVEILLVSNVDNLTWKCIGKNIPDVKKEIYFKNNLVAKIISKNKDFSKLRFNLSRVKLDKWLNENGYMPIPPYISKTRSHQSHFKDVLKDKSTYQTVYAKSGRSIAAPTAGLHFTNKLLNQLDPKGVKTAYLNLDVGFGTFKPVETENLAEHKIHSENYSMSPSVAQYLNDLKQNNIKIISVGTTTTRVLESIAEENCKLKIDNLKGATRLFIYPPYKFKFIDGLITNFHLPGSTLLALVYAFGGEKLIKKAYSEAIKHKYRFYSYGDAMLII